MAEIAAPLARQPFPHVSSTTSTQSRLSISSPKGPTNSRHDSLPTTPDRQGTDPLSAHIFARTQPEPATEAPSFTRNISELVISKFKDESRDETPSNISSDVEAKDTKKRVSFFAKLRGKDKLTEDFLETPEEVSRTEGAYACTFSGRHAAENPNYIRVRARNKAKKDFNNLFLAQELECENDLATEGASVDNESHGSAIWSMKFSPDGRYLATGGQDMVVRIWRVLSSPADRKADASGVCQVDSMLNAPVFCQKPFRQYQGHTADVLDLSWSTNNFLLSSSMDKTVRLWHVSREECLCCFQHSDFVTSIAFHPKDDRIFVSGSLDCKLRLWNIQDKKVSCWNELPELITAVAFDPAGRMVIAGSFTGLCLFYETDGLRYHTQVHVRSSRGRNARGHKITGIQAVNNDVNNPHSETKLLITSNDSRIRLYSLRDKSLLFKLKGNENTSSQIRASFNEDCKYVICGSEDKQVYIWNAVPNANDQKIQFGYEHFEAHNGIVSATCFAPSKSRDLLATSDDPIYDFVSKHHSTHDTNSTTSSEHNHKVNGSADGNIIVCADYSGRIKVFRQDSAFSLRHRTDEKSETASIMSKKVLRKSSVKSLDAQSKTGSQTNLETSSVVRKPHEFAAPVSTARIRAKKSQIAEETPKIQINGQALRSDTIDSAGMTTRTSDTDDHDAIMDSTRQHDPGHYPRSRASSKDAHVSSPKETKVSPHSNHHHHNHRHKETGNNAHLQGHKDQHTRSVKEVSENIKGRVMQDEYLAEGGQSLEYYDISSRPVQERSHSIASTWSSGLSRQESAVQCQRCGSTSFSASRKNDSMALKCTTCGTLLS